MEEMGGVGQSLAPAPKKTAANCVLNPNIVAVTNSYKHETTFRH